MIVLLFYTQKYKLGENCLRRKKELGDVLNEAEKNYSRAHVRGILGLRHCHKISLAKPSYRLLLNVGKVD